MNYVRLRRCCFTFTFMIFMFVGNEISKAKMFGKVATLSDIEEMLNEFKSHYETLFSANKEIRNSSWKERMTNGSKIQQCSRHYIIDNFNELYNEK